MIFKIRRKDESEGFSKIGRLMKVLLINMKKVITLTIGTLLLVALGCTTTVTVGTKANKDQVVGAKVGLSGASLTLPLVKGEVTPTTP